MKHTKLPLNNYDINTDIEPTRAPGFNNNSYKKPTSTNNSLPTLC